MKFIRKDSNLTFDQMVMQNIREARPFALFAFLLTQAGTAAPSFSTLFTDFAPMLADTPAVPVFARTGAGVYTLTLAGATFTAGKIPKTGGLIDAATGTRYSIEYTSATVLTIRSFAIDGTPTDGLFTGKLIEAKVWD